MRSRLLVGGLALSLLAPVAVRAQGVTIDHQEIGCIIAGKYPKLNACFSPASSVKKARVYFRPETVTQWYYVEMTSDAPCHKGILLRPTKALIDKHIYYYVDVDGGARTQEYAPIVVASEENCRKKLPIAPLSATGPASFGPSLPPFFLGGGGLSPVVVGGGVATAALVTGGALLLTHDDSPATSLPATVPVTSPPATNPPVTAPPDSLPGRPGALVVACQATPRSGDAPLRVQFSTFPSGGTGTYEFLWTFGDGASSNNPNPAHTFTSAGVFDSTVRVLSGDLIATCSRPITVTSPPPAPGPSPSSSPSASPSPSPAPSPSPSPSPTTFTLNVSLTGSGTGTVTGSGINCPGVCTLTYPVGTVVTLTATPASPPPTVFKQWTGDCTGTGPCTVTMTANRNVVADFELLRTLTVAGGTNGSDTNASVTSNPAGINCAWTPNLPCTTSAPFVNGTSVALTVVLAPPGTRVQWGGACAAATGLVCNVPMNSNQLVTIDSFRLFAPDKAAPSLAWSSQLEVPGGEGQVVTNGRIASAVRPGMASVAAEGRTGTNRVEAVLVRGAGRPGTWRFDFAGQPGFRSGSLRVIAGTVVVITADAVSFRLEGKPGERLVFSFEIDP